MRGEKTVGPTADLSIFKLYAFKHTIWETDRFIMLKCESDPMKNKFVRLWAYNFRDQWLWDRELWDLYGQKIFSKKVSNWQKKGLTNRRG